MVLLNNGPGTSIHAELRAGQHAPNDARRALELLDERLPPETARTLALVASELVTNSVRHSPAGSGAAIELDAAIDDDVVRLSIRDAGRGFQPQASADRDSPGGWGLQVVDQLVDRWWVENEDGTRVTCELRAGFRRTT
jgi:two-component sensor histidine kinase